MGCVGRSPTIAVPATGTWRMQNAQMAEKIRIIPVGRQALFREAVGVALEKEPDFEVVAEASNGLQAVALAEQTGAHMVLIHSDVAMEEAIHATRLITTHVPGCRVAIL